MKNPPSDFRSNSPLTQPPADYFPPGSRRFFEIRTGLDAGKAMFHFDHRIGAFDPEATVVLVHGNPESSYTYRHVRDALLASGRPMRLIAMDHIGFGLSDQADFEMVDMHHAANLLQLIQHLDLRDVSLVVHDWGGPIGIGAFANEPWRVRNLLVANSTIFPMPGDGPTYANFPTRWLPWSKTPHVIPDRLWGGLAAYVVSHAEPQSRASFYWNVARSVLAHASKSFDSGSPEAVWSDQFRSQANARSSKRNVLQTPVWGHGYRYDDPRLGPQDNRTFYRQMQEVIPREWGPAGRNIEAAGYFGSWDACGKKSVIKQWCTALPRMQENLHVFPQHGHFIEEHQGPAMAGSILKMNSVK